jgi:hypothetical protein
VAPIALEVELLKYGGVEELAGNERIPDEWPVEEGEVPVRVIVECVLVLTLDLL